MEPRRETFAVHTYEVDAFDLLAAPALAGYLQEIAGLHAADMGCGMETLAARGLSWVLSRLRLEVLAPIALGETLEIATWPTGVDRLMALRDFSVSRRDGGVVARAVTEWLVIEIGTRRPVRPRQVLEARFHPESEHVLPVPEQRLPAPAAAEDEKRFRTRYQDIDRNLHVNNATYVAWALEAVPQETWRTCRLASLEAHHLAECFHGSTVLSRIAAAGPATFLHSVVREEDGKELARLRTRWVAR